MNEVYDYDSKSGDIIDPAELKLRAAGVLAANARGRWTQPAPGLYPHQWLWDSCFIAIGLAQLDPSRAAGELLGLLRGQWPNGMMPHMIYNSRLPYRLESNLWRTGNHGPRGVATSAITQPPVLALATEVVAEALGPMHRLRFLAQMLPAIERYHDWLYRERDPENTGLVTLIHPWESGMDDAPYWGAAMSELPRVNPKWRWLRETRLVKRSERASDIDVQRMQSLVEVINDANGDTANLARTAPVRMQDVGFNSLLVAAQEAAERLTALTGSRPSEAKIRRRMRTAREIENMWHDGQYYSREQRFGGLIVLDCAATFLPLVAGAASPDRAEQLRSLLVSDQVYGGAHPIAFVPFNSPAFEPQRYWRGPIWININWLTWKGLLRYDFAEEAEWLRLRTLELVDEHGFYEYYHAKSGAGLGAHDFSWTAALVLALLAG